MIQQETNKVETINMFRSQVKAPVYHDAETKLKAVAEVHSGATLEATAKKYNVHMTTVNGWVRKGFKWGKGKNKMRNRVLPVPLINSQSTESRLEVPIDFRRTSLPTTENTNGTTTTIKDGTILHSVTLNLDQGMVKLTIDDIHKITSLSRLI